MISKKHLVCLVTAFLIFPMLFGIFGCAKQDSHQRSSIHPTTRIMVNQYVSHSILDAVLEGIRERLAQEEDMEIIVKNSNNDAMITRQINEQFMRQNPSVIVALGTPAAQSAVQVADGKVPVVFSAITDPVGAKLADSLERPGGNKTGTTNRWPFEEQMRLVREMRPGVKTVGVIVNPGEDNCMAGVEVFRKVARELEMTLVEVPAINTSEVKTAATVLAARRVDAMLISPSNTVFSALDSLIATAWKAGIPVFGGDETAVERGSIATYGFSNKDVGVATAEIILEVLKSEKAAGEIPVARPKQNRLYVNTAALERYKIVIPEKTSAAILEK